MQTSGQIDVDVRFLSPLVWIGLRPGNGSIERDSTDTTLGLFDANHQCAGVRCRHVEMRGAFFPVRRIRSDARERLLALSQRFGPRELAYAPSAEELAEVERELLNVGPLRLAYDVEPVEAWLPFHLDDIAYDWIVESGFRFLWGFDRSADNEEEALFESDPPARDIAGFASWLSANGATVPRAQLLGALVYTNSD